MSDTRYRTGAKQADDRGSEMARRSRDTWVDVQDDDDYFDEPDLPTHMNWCCRCCTPQQSFPCRILFFLIILGLDIADLISDWLLYTDVSMAEVGLVYGPPSDAVIYALLAFSIVGSLTFIFETVNLWWEVFRNNPWLDTDLVSALTIWLEDLPQISINVYIAMCREDPISIFQLIKASIVLISLFIRIIISLVKYCNKAALREARMKTTESERHLAFRIFIMLGLFINAGCAVTVFIFTQTQHDVNGGLSFQVPETVFEDTYNDQQYFQNVSVFVHQSYFDRDLPDKTNGYQSNWVRFMSINDIRNQKDLTISYNYVYVNASGFLHMALYIQKEKKSKKGMSKWTFSECYKMDWTSRNVTAVDYTDCSVTFGNATRAVSVYITFSFTPPDPFFRRLIFGDIRFNVKILHNGSCGEFDQFTNDVSDNVTAPAIHYYRTNRDISANNALHLLKDGDQPRFYRNDGIDLEDITQVWKTGWGRCESSGSKAPHLETEIITECSNNI